LTTKAQKIPKPARGVQAVTAKSGKLPLKIRTCEKGAVCIACAPLMRSAQLREKFLKYFEGRDHKRVKSSSLVPQNDPTLFFVNAGMVQFKETFTGAEKRSYTRATTSQKCMRVSGKHNDLEQVGMTQRHHTFFEMLGNFSFGDYFKKDAIAFAWEFLTKEVGVPADRLIVTVFENDDEAEELWQAHISKDRIFRLGEKDNFWSMGETGPCGPCSEIHFDKRPGAKITKADLETDRFMEVWNLVFMQFERFADGTMKPLAKPSIDTGMGLERLCSVVEGTEGNYETDIFMPIIEAVEKLSGVKYGARYGSLEHCNSRGSNREPSLSSGSPLNAAGMTDVRESSLATDFSIRVIADHIRASVFLIGDGVQPSNEGRGYVLRRIIRRAIRHGKLLGQEGRFFAPLAHVVIDNMASAYPELAEHRAFIERVLSHEEERFCQTLDRGLEMLECAFMELAKTGKKAVCGDVVFKLYDTFGFPKDLTRDIAFERCFDIDEEGFEKCMLEQREKARAAWKGSGEEQIDDIYKEMQQRLPATKFVGYDHVTCEAKVLEVMSCGCGDKVKFVTDKTCFYGEGGGQVGDIGMAVADGLAVVITDSKKPVAGLIVHEGVVEKGELKAGMKVTLAVDVERRNDIRRNHTATHLLHKALRETLGEHVKQAGSYVGPDRLRFDFSHFQAVTPAELKEIESEVNEVIRKNLKASNEELSYDEAVSRGALAFFGEKYGATVRMLDVEGYSVELCGGTHVLRTGDIGLVKILSESSVASGVRRIEAVTGRGAEEYVASMEATLKGIAGELKSSVADVPSRVKKLQEKIRALEKQLESGVSQAASNDVQIENIGGVNCVIARVAAANVAGLRNLSDKFRDKVGSGVVVLASEIDGKISLIACVTKDLTGKFKAGDIIKKLAAIVGGTGGGRPDMAQGGGSDISKIDEALNEARKFLSA